MLEALDVVAIELSERFPIQMAKLVTRRVLLVLRELDTLTMVGALVEAGEDAVHHCPRPESHPGKAREGCGVEQLNHAFTSARRLSTIWPEVTPSLSA